MMIELTNLDIEVVRTSLQYAKERVSGNAETPYEVRKENLARIDAILQKLPRVVAHIDK